MRHLRAQCSILTVATVILLSSSAAVAQVSPGSSAQPEAPETAAPSSASANAAPTAAEGEIVVTAQRRTERLQDVPISASVTSGLSLQRSNTLDLQSLAVGTPAVHISTAPVSDFISIRGVGSSLNLGFEQSVATFVDGIYRGRSRSTRAALFDAERVEVLKGPQTTFFGNNAIAGAFNITTRKPGNTLEANSLAFYAPATNEYIVEAGVTVPVSQTLSFRLAGRASGMNGYIYNDVLGEKGPRQRDEIGRISARWKPTDTIETNARFDIGRSRDSNTWLAQALDCPPQPVFGAAKGACARYLAASGGTVDDKLDGHTADNPSFFNYDYYEAAQTTSVGIGTHSLTFTTGYSQHKYDLLNDVIPAPASKGGSVIPGQSQVIPARFIERYHQFSQEVRFQSAQNQPIEYMIGGYYAHDDLNIAGYQGFFQAPLGATVPAFYTAASPIAARVFNTQTSETKSIFGSATARIGGSLRINLGARYSIVDKNAHRSVEQGIAGAQPGPDNFIPGPAAAQAFLLPSLGFNVGDFAYTKRTDKKFLPAASVQLDLVRDVMAYASYAKGFKAGGFSAFSSNSIFNPERVDAYELGVKSQLFDRKLSLSLALFLSDYSDLQETTTIQLANGSQVQIVGNVAKSRSKGIELGARFRAAQGLTFSTELAYLDARYTDYVGAPCTTLQALQRSAPCTQDLSGQPRAFAPKYSGSFSADYDAALGSRYRLRANATVFYTSRFFQQPVADPFLSQAPYAKVDGRIGVATRDDRWELAVVGKNLTNERTASFRQSIPTSPGSIEALADPLRSIGLQLSWKY